MYNAKFAFLKSKNDKTPPGFNFGIESPFVDKNDNPLPIFGSSPPVLSPEPLFTEQNPPIEGAAYSISMSKVNDEPTKVQVSTARTTPQGVIRHKKNFEIDRKHRMKYKPSKQDVKAVQDLKTEISQEMKDSIESSLDEPHKTPHDSDEKYKEGEYSEFSDDPIENPSQSDHIPSQHDKQDDTSMHPDKSDDYSDDPIENPSKWLHPDKQDAHSSFKKLHRKGEYSEFSDDPIEGPHKSDQESLHPDKSDDNSDDPIEGPHKSDQESDDPIEDAIDELSKKLKRAGFNQGKIKTVKKLLFNVLD